MSEIELILLKLKICSEGEGAYICDTEHCKILLDYINGEKIKKDKAIKLINKKKALFTNDVVQTKIINELLDILEGSDKE